MNIINVGTYNVHKLVNKNVKLVWVSIFALSTFAFSCVDEGNKVLIPLEIPGSAMYPIYKHGDFIEYTVTGTVTPEGGDPNFGASGTLRIYWEDLTIPLNPFSIEPVPINALRERTELKVDLLGTFNSIRYIQQDPNTHELKLMAIEDQNNKLFWISTENNISKNPITPIPLGAIINESPIPSNLLGKTDYYVLANCSSSSQSCEEVIASVSTTTEFSRIISEGTSTIIGLFETVRLNLLTKTFTLEPGIDSNSANYFPFSSLDVLTACTNSSSPNTSNSGDFDVHPSVGIVFMFSSCIPLNSATSNTFGLYFELSGVGGSIKIPSSN